MSLNYCVELLTKRDPKPGYEEVIRMKKELHDVRMKEQKENDIEELSWEQFEVSIKKVFSKHKDKYKFIMNGGTSLIKAFYSLFSLIWKKEGIPVSWYNGIMV